jgi:hypothetical protein
VHAFLVIISIGACSEYWVLQSPNTLVNEPQICSVFVLEQQSSVISVWCRHRCISVGKMKQKSNDIQESISFGHHGCIMARVFFFPMIRKIIL